ncbi:hypothetical protein HMPREF3177_00570 [Nosocomiicoccus sp. HMSC09A07]|nr:hypothetical protein HMPREF3177_00570 [Nosocomiicoccus sp. HMSC09A07]
MLLMRNDNMKFKWLFVLLFVAFGGTFLFSNIDMLIPYRKIFLFVVLLLFIVAFITSIFKLKNEA